MQKNSMRKHIFIGCDIGTSGTKAVAVDQDGKQLATARIGYQILQKFPNWAEQNPKVWMDAAVEAIRSVTARIEEPLVSAVCISALYGGTGVLCDDRMEPLRPAIIWMDRRAGEEGRWVREHIGEREVFDVSGNGTDSYFGYTKLLWVKNHEPEIWKRIRCVLPVHSYLVYRMTGKITIDYSSAGNFGGIYDYRNGCWSENMCRNIGIDLQILPTDFKRPEEIVGEINEEYGKKMGFTHPVSVCAGTVDCISSMMSAGLIKPGDHAAVLGTSLNWGYIHGEFPPAPNVISMPYGVHPKTLSYSYGGASTAGALPRWFVSNVMGMEEEYAYGELEREIEAQHIGPGSGGLIVLPYFMGERTPLWDEHAQGVIFGLQLSHTRAHIYRAVLESVAYSLRHIMETMAEGELAQKIILVGGGAQSILWQHIFADVTGLPVHVPVNPVEAPLGDAFFAAMGLGVLKDWSEIGNWVRFRPPVKPDENHKRIYQEYFDTYKKLYPSLKENMNEFSHIRLQIQTEKIEN